MKIYRDRILYDEVPARKRRPGEYFPRLVAFNVSIDGNSFYDMHVEPIYIPLVRFQRRDGGVHIEINSTERPLLYIALSRRKPWITIFRFDWTLLED